MNLTVQSVLTESESKLRSAAIAVEDASIIIAHMLSIRREDLLTHPERAISAEEYITIERALNKRLAGYSVATITGHKEFYGLDFIVTEDTLIPRPDTELIIEKALDYLKQHDHQTVLDMGTGSGCIIITVAKQMHLKHNAYYATDISEKALAVARRNALHHRTPVHFFRSNLFESAGSEKYTLILANLPYLTTDQLREPSIKREPVGALWGGSEGLDIYRAFLEQAAQYVTEHFSILIEIDPAQSPEIQKIAQGSFPEATITTSKDLADRVRLVSIVL